MGLNGSFSIGFFHGGIAMTKSSASVGRAPIQSQRSNDIAHESHQRNVHSFFITLAIMVSGFSMANIRPWKWSIVSMDIIPISERFLHLCNHRQTTNASICVHCMVLTIIGALEGLEVQQRNDADKTRARYLIDNIL
jgi:hypothetical protein